MLARPESKSVRFASVPGSLVDCQVHFIRGSRPNPWQISNRREFASEFVVNCCDKSFGIDWFPKPSIYSLGANVN